MNPSSQPLVSVVTPVYNGAEFLAECIESVLAQTYQNWDFTIVNNCSTDNSGEIARRYAEKDSRIRVHENKQFLRAVPNHNVALRHLSPESKYCKVLLADDWIFPECLERMVAVGEQHASVGIVGAYGMKENEVVWVGLPYPSTLVPGREICRRLFLEGLYVFGSATSLMYRADIVRERDPFYNESNFHADMEACVLALKTCDFGFVHQVLTFSRVRPGSLETISSDINTLTAGKLHDLVTHGHDYLSQEEYKACLDRRLFDYYATLVGGVLRLRDRKFWDYHKRKLREAGVGFSRIRLAKVALIKLFGAISNPGAAVRKARQVSNEIADRRRPSVRGMETR
jgi:glycosyltransferase involved in cell wall biosynthesis